MIFSLDVKQLRILHSRGDSIFEELSHSRRVICIRGMIIPYIRRTPIVETFKKEQMGILRS